MSVAALVLGCIAIVLYMLSRLPLMRFVNIIALPIALVGIVVGAIALASGGHITMSIVGLVLSILAMVFGWERLVGSAPLGGGRPA